MMDKPVVVIVGEMFGNKTIHGPFEDSDYLNQWVSQFAVNQRYEVVPIQVPEHVKTTRRRETDRK